MADTMDPAEIARARRMSAGLDDLTLLGTLKRDRHHLAPEAVRALEEELATRGIRVHPWDDFEYFPISTLPDLDDYRVTRVLGIVGAEHPVFINESRESLVPFMTSPEQRTGALAGTMGLSRSSCLADLESKARRLMADAVIGVSFHLAPAGHDPAFVLMHATGTAVQVQPGS